MTTVMWEVRAADGRTDELVRWALARAHGTADVYRGEDGRVVVIDPSGTGLPDPPADLICRPAHVWPFEPVPR
jgi:hypothetical protein